MRAVFGCVIALIVLPSVLQAQRHGTIDPNIGTAPRLPPPRFATATAIVHATVQVLPGIAFDGGRPVGRGPRSPASTGHTLTEILIRDRPVARLLATDRMPLAVNVRPAHPERAWSGNATSLPQRTSLPHTLSTPNASTPPATRPSAREAVVIEVVVLL